MTKYSKLLMMFLAIIVLMSCSDDDDEPKFKSLQFSFNGLENLGSDYVYEGWLIVNGSPVSAGRFSIDDNGQASRNSLELPSDVLDQAGTYVLTIEPAVNDDPAPSKVHILAGDFVGKSSSLSIDHAAALGTDFSSVSGNFILATPTNGAGNDENSGVWFLDLSSGSPAKGLNLPTLPDGWVYEGWAVINGTPVTTGTFTDGMMADNFDGFSGSMPGPPFPGEDFLTNPPSGMSFPVDLAGGVAVISVEPDPDNSAAPFTLKPLVGQIPSDATDHTTYAMQANLSFPTGTVSRP